MAGEGPMEFMYVLLVVELVFIVLVAIGLWFGLKALRRRAGGGGAGGGWSALEAAWGVEEAPKDPIVGHGTLFVGKILWRNCVAVGIDPRGLHLAVRAPIFGGFGKSPVRIPWDAFRASEPAQIQWQEARLWHLGEPEVTTLTLPREIEAALAAKGRVLGRG